MRALTVKIAASSLVFGILFFATSASAEERTTADVRDAGNGSLTYEFYDDPLAAGNLAPTGGGITVVNRHVRTLLIRPRAQFVTEMLKSVENL